MRWCRWREQAPWDLFCFCPLCVEEHRMGHMVAPVIEVRCHLACTDERSRDSFLDGLGQLTPRWISVKIDCSYNKPVHHSCTMLKYI